VIPADDDDDEEFSFTPTHLGKSLAETLTYATPFPEDVPEFKSFEKAVEWWLAYSRQHDFCISTINTANGDWKDGVIGKRKGRIICTKGGHYKEKKPKEGSIATSTKTSKNSKKTGCEWHVSYSCQHKKGGSFKITSSNMQHNHPREGPGAHHRHRKLTPQMEEYALSSVNKMAPSQALTDLKAKFKTCIATYDDMHNLQKVAFQKERNGLCATQAMLEVIESAQMPHKFCKDPVSKELQIVLVTDPMAIVLAQEYGQVLLMDCTYKTNKYNYPLLHIVSHTGAGTTFTVAFGFMKQETTEYYTKALKMLRALIPLLPTKVVVTDADLALKAALETVCPEWRHILCRWHLAQNIKKNCRTGMPLDEWILFMMFWRDIIESETEEIYRSRLQEFEKQYRGQEDRHHVWEYSMSRLVPGEREKYVSCWVNKVPHLGNTSTSRVEGGHSKLKKDLKSCRGDFFHVVGVLCNALHVQQRGAIDELTRQRSRYPQVSKAAFQAVS
jgi:hypothetical protein